jgi:hypothetical protein
LELSDDDDNVDIAVKRGAKTKGANKTKFTLKIGKRQDQGENNKLAEQKLEKQEQKEEQQVEILDWPYNDEKSEYEKIMVSHYFSALLLNTNTYLILQVFCLPGNQIIKMEGCLSESHIKSPSKYRTSQVFLIA